MADSTLITGSYAEGDTLTASIVTVTGTDTGVGVGGVRVSIAFNDVALEPYPTWTDVTALHPSLVAGYDKQVGRQFELDLTGTGNYTVMINDVEGILDPTNSSGPLYELIQPDIQVKVDLWNPMALEWQTRMRVWIDDYDYTLDPSQEVMALTLTCYDIFALLARIEMQPGQFGNTPPAPPAAQGVVFFNNMAFDGRINDVLGNAIGATAAAFWAVVFSGNVNLLNGTYSPGTDPLSPIQDCADAEFPGVSNVYPDRFGRLAAHGRLAKFDPHGTWVSIAATDALRDAQWAFREWKCGDGAAVALSPSDTAQLRPPYSFNLGTSKCINSAYCTPLGWPTLTTSHADVVAQTWQDLTSQGIRGIRSWSKNNLLIDNSILTGNTGLDECLLYSKFFVANYAEPRERVTALTFRSISPERTGAAATWKLLCGADIADSIALTIAHPGGGGFNLEPFYIEGVTESVRPLRGDFADVTLTLDVSPVVYFDNPVGLDHA